MKKIILALILTAPMATQSSPCGVELCLSDFRMATSIQECKNEMDEFFSIIDTHKGKFSSGKTRQARRNFLYQCESGNDAIKETILETFGDIYKPSY